MKRRLKENIEIGDRVFVPRDEYQGTVVDINGDEVLVDGPFGEEYHNLSDLEKLGGDYDETPKFFEKYVTESKRKKIIRLTESDLARIVRRIVNEQGQGPIGGFGGPLTGTLVARNPDDEVRFGQDIEFTFRGIKNSGSAPITIKRILPMNSGMRIDKQVPFTVNPGETFELRAKQRLVRGGTSLEKVNEEGLVEFEGIIRVETDGKKQNYQLYCRQNLSFR
jgi:hypothetical protein